MWGNRLGWTIAAIILLGGVAAAAWLRQQMQITAPTELSLNPENLAELSPPDLARPVVAQGQPGDAAVQYGQAIAAYDEDDCANFIHNPAGLAPAAMRLVLEATHLKDMNLFAREPGKVIDYQADHAALDNLNRIGRDIDGAALVLAKMRKNTKQARLYYEAVYALGSKLCRERVDYDEYARGMGLMDAATTGMAECEPDNSVGREELARCEPAMVAYDAKHVRPIYEVLASADPNVIEKNAGDVFRFAEQVDHERMFRVEAILKLGRYRFDAARKADQLAAPRYIQRFLQDGDPVIQAAAQAAQSLTVEQYRMIH